MGRSVTCFGRKVKQKIAVAPDFNIQYIINTYFNSNINSYLLIYEYVCVKLSKPAKSNTRSDVSKNFLQPQKEKDISINLHSK